MSQREKRSLPARPANATLPEANAWLDGAAIITGEPTNVGLPSRTDASDTSIGPLDKLREQFQAQSAAADKFLRELKKQERREFAIRATLWLIATPLFVVAGQWMLTVTSELRAANSFFRWLPLGIYSGLLAATLWGLLLGHSTKILLLKISYVAFVLVLTLVFLAGNGFFWWEIIGWALGISQPNLLVMCLAGFGSLLVFQFLRGVVGDGDLLCSILGIDRRQK